MSVLGGGRRRSRRSDRHKNVTWNNFNRNLTSWRSDKSSATEPDEPSHRPTTTADLPTTDDVVFRRNATLSTMQHEHRAKLERQRVRTGNLHRRQLKIIAGSILIIVALTVALVSQFATGFTVTSADNTPLSSADVVRYSNLVTQYLGSNPLERFSFSRRQNALMQFVQTRAPEVSNVQLQPAGFGGGNLRLTFRRPVAMWASDGVTNFVDSGGAVFTKNYFASPSVTITDDSGVAPANGQATSGGFLSFVGQIESNLATNGLMMQRVVIPRGAIRYVDIYLQGRNYPFMAQIDRDPTAQAADIVASVHYLDANKITPQYADVRVAGKMYWK